jgi:hypothetical protein
MLIPRRGVFEIVVLGSEEMAAQFESSRFDASVYQRYIDPLVNQLPFLQTASTTERNQFYEMTDHIINYFETATNAYVANLPPTSESATRAQPTPPDQPTPDPELLTHGWNRLISNFNDDDELQTVSCLEFKCFTTRVLAGYLDRTYCDEGLYGYAICTDKMESPIRFGDYVMIAKGAKRSVEREYKKMLCLGFRMKPTGGRQRLQVWL